jgi:dihydrodipicolinate reductase
MMLDDVAERLRLCVADTLRDRGEQHKLLTVRQLYEDVVPYHAVRAGDNPGEHTILFGMLGETLEIRVAATNRDCYAQGALLAAEWLIGKPPGLYGMNDVLGL